MAEISVSAGSAKHTRAGSDFRLIRVIGKSFVEVIGKEATEALMQHFQKVLTGERVEYEERVPFKVPGWRR